MTYKTNISKIRSIIVTFAQLFLNSVAIAAPMTFSRIGVEQGLSQSSVLCITQDNLGRIWLGTQDGLNRYDGHAFEVFKSDISDTTSLQNSFITALYTDSEGQVWIGTASGLSRYDAKASCFTNYNEYHLGSVNHICSYNESLAISTDVGLFLFQPDNNSILQIPFDSEHIVRWSCPIDRSLLVATDVGLFLLREDKIEQITNFSGIDIHAISPSQDGGWWIGVYGKGLYRTDSRFKILHHYTEERGLPSDYVRVLQTDRVGRLWVGTYEGLAVYDDLNGTFNIYRHDNTLSSLSHDSIRAIYADTQNGIWICTWNGGVNYWNNHNDKLRDIPLSGDGIYGFASCLCKDFATNRIWVGTNDDGLFIYHSDNGQITRPSVPMLSKNIKCIVSNSEGNLYIGTHMGGITSVNTKNSSTRNISINKHIPIKNSCYSLLEITPGHWIVGSLEGLFVFDEKNNKVFPHPAVTQTPELGRSIITALYKDRSGQIWIGTNDGVYRLSLTDGVIESQAQIFPNINVKGLYISQILQDNDGRIWIASSHGLIEYSGSSRSRIYTMADGLPGNNIRSLLYNKTHLWICTGRKICNLHMETGKIKAINRQTSNEFTPGASCLGANGTFYFGGLGGLTCFDPDDLYSNPYSPQPFFTSVSFDPRYQGELERNEIGACVRVNCSSNSAPLLIHWSVVNPLSHGDDIFYYRLVGLDNQWQQTKERVAAFTNLSPGKYNLQLRSANNEGIICEGMSTLELNVIPHWWQSNLFKAFLILLASLLACIVIWLVISLISTKTRLHSRNAEILRLENSLDKTHALLTEQVRDIRPEEKSGDKEFLIKAIHIVESNIDNSAFSSEDFAQQMYMSRSKLYVRIQEASGETVADFIRRIRFKRACALLLEECYSVSEVSAMVGFSSPAYFATCFKKYMGCLPKEYCKSSKEKVHIDDDQLGGKSSQA